MNRWILLTLLLMVLECSLSTSAGSSETGEFLRSEAQTHVSRGDRHYLEGDLRSAHAEYEKALRIFTEVDDALGAARCLIGIGQAELDSFRLGEAKRLFEQALAIRQRMLPAEHADIAESYQNLANLSFASGRFEEARGHYERAIEIGSRALGKDHQDIASAKRSLGQLAQMMGRNSEAEVLYREALGILEKGQGRSDWRTAEARVVLAKHLAFEGDLETARAELESGLRILESVLGAYHLSTIGAQLATCTVARLQGDVERAGDLVIRMESGIRRAIPREHPLNAEFLEEAALVLQTFGKGREAEGLLRQSLEIKSEVYGTDHPNTIITLRNLAVLLHARGTAQEAARLFKELHLRAARSLPADSPEMASLLGDLSIYLFETDQKGSALRTLQQALEVEDLVLESLLSGTSEREVRLLLSRHYLDLPISAHLQYGQESARSGRLAFESVLRRKGLGLDVALRGHQIRRRQDSRHPELAADLRVLRDEQIRLWMGLPGESSETTQLRRLEELRQEIDAKERRLRSKLELPVENREITVEAVQEKLAIGQALLEFVNYAVVESDFILNPHRTRETRYAVGILRAQGPVEWVDLGLSSEIDDLAVAYRDALQSVGNGHRAAGQKLYNRTFGRLEIFLRGTNKLEVSLAGTLQFIPLASLIDPRGRYLIERFSINVLPSGRDLLRKNEKKTPWRGAVLIGGLDYAEASRSRPATTDGSAGFLGGAHFSRLAATGPEVEAIGSVLGASVLAIGGGRILHGLDAEEKRLDEIHGPTILHIATHGFFQPEHNLNSTLRSSSDSRRRRGFIDPLLRSGLALSRANAWLEASGADDGILTALEIRDLDLSGTQLAVLSACETGLGEGAYNQGLYGMRRALSVAGAKTQVLTLWPVADTTTRDLMISFYEQLKAGIDRADALRNVQLAFAKGERLPKTCIRPRGAQTGEGRRPSSHPYFWAGFVISGSRGPLLIPVDPD